MNKVTSIFEKIDNAKQLDFGDIFNESIELFKKGWLYAFLLQLFILIVSMPLIIVLYAPLVMSIIADSKSGDIDTNVFGSLFAGLSVFYIVIFILGILAVAVFQTALNAAFFRVLNSIDEGHDVSVSDLFHFLKGGYFGSVTMLTFAIVLIAVLAALLCYVPLIYAMIPLSFIPIVFAFNSELSTGDIVKISFKLGTKKWLISFGLFVVAYALVLVLTLLTCGIGSLFLSPFIYFPLYLVYKQVIGFDGVDEIEQIGETNSL